MLQVTDRFKSISIFLFLLFLWNALNMYPQEPDPYSFFPSAIGNVWQYSTYYGFQEIKILKDSLDDEGNKYIFIYQLDKPDYKIDTNFNVYYVLYGSYLKYKLNAELGESWTVFPETEGGERNDFRVDSIFQEYIFNEIRTVKKLGYYYLPRGDTVINDLGYLGYDYLISGLGRFMSWDVHEGPTEILTGCIINGDTLGDVVSSVIEVKIPSSFNLFQNFPNPFNPSTTIEYELPENSFVTLKVYNIIGEEVKILTEEYQQKGTHKIVFNAGTLASGVYIYNIRAGSFFASRKMLLQK